jgi:nucleotide-binding universal stress UspA family protein
MLKSVLIGLDGSPTSGAAVELGIQWAKRFNALLVGLAVVVEFSIHTREPESIRGDDSNREHDGNSMERARRATERSLEQFAARCTEAGVSFNLLQGTGAPYDEILRESHRCDLVLFGQRNSRLLVMGAYGHSTMREFLLGSLTSTVLKESPLPVFLCH